MKENLQVASRPERVGLPSGIQACLFDLDGVLTRTAVVHAAAWKEMFDAFLRARAEATGEPFREFDSLRDYDEFVDGRPRLDGVRTFLASRGITLPEGQETDPPGTPTVWGLATQKNDLVLRLIRERGVEAYPGSVTYLKAVREAGLASAVVSASANCQAVLETAGITSLLDVRVDGIVADQEHLKGKPAPDTFLAAARRLGIEPTASAVFEDALAGVEAGHAGGFGIVVGVDRVHQGDALRQHGADVVVQDLAELLPA